MLSLTMGCLHPRLGITRRSMLRVPVKQHTGATPVCIIWWIYLAALRLNRSESRFDLRPATSIASGNIIQAQRQYALSAGSISLHLV